MSLYPTKCISWHVHTAKVQISLTSTQSDHNLSFLPEKNFGTVTSHRESIKTADRIVQMLRWVHMPTCISCWVLAQMCKQACEL